MNTTGVAPLSTGSLETWLLQLHSAQPKGIGVQVGRLLPQGYPRYIRLFHPLSLSDDGVRCRPRTWRSVADAAGLVFHPEVQWRLLRPRIEGTFAGQTTTALAFLQESEGKADPDQLGRWPLEGTIGEPSGSRLFDLLAQVAGTQQVYFYYGTAASFLCLKDMLFRAPMTAYRAVQELADRAVAPPTSDGVRVPGPELVWPEDRSWVVATDCDLVSTYVACDERLADLLASDPLLEVLPVTLATRIDFDADSINA
jgi:hypothetical protein